jgi:hypothetical protein
MERISEKSLQQVLASRQRDVTTMLDYWAQMQRTFTLQGDMV